MILLTLLFLIALMHVLAITRIPVIGPHKSHIPSSLIDPKDCYYEYDFHRLHDALNTTNRCTYY